MVNLRPMIKTSDSANTLPSRQQGFTLIELLTVMAIIGILATIVLSIATGATDTSQDASVQQSTSAVKSAVTEFNKEQTGA